MNRDCHGDFYEIDGARWYRCLLDSTIIERQQLQDHSTCPRCARIICATDHGKVETRAFTLVELKLGNRWLGHSMTPIQAKPDKDDSLDAQIGAVLIGRGYLDRMKDVTEEDTADDIVRSFLWEVQPILARRRAP